MLAVYIAALIFGLGSALLQLATGSDSGGDSSAPLDGAVDPEAPAPLDTGTEHALATHGAHGAGHTPGWLGVFLSFRFVVFAATAFGLVGTPATLLGSTPAGLTFAVALAVGLLVGALASSAFELMRRQTLSSSTASAELIGQLGRVLVACEKARPGKVRLHVRGQTSDHLATTDDDRLVPGTPVVVVDVRAHALHVTEAPKELALE